MNIETTFCAFPFFHQMRGKIENDLRGRMQIIPHSPVMLQGSCYWNADNFVKKNGGTVTHGWMILLQPKAFAMAMYHAVVQTASGDFVDVTATPFKSTGKTSFIIDESLAPSRVFPPYIDNVYWPFTPDDCVLQYIAHANDGHRISREIVALGLKQNVIVWNGDISKLTKTPELVRLCKAQNQSINNREKAAADILAI